jgi:hypothetical protein
MSTATSIPSGLADTDDEVVNAWLVYGQAGVRNGMRYPEPVARPVFGEGFVDSACANIADYSEKSLTPEQTLRCGPFRTDLWTAPLHYPMRDENVDDLPPR